MLQEILQKKVMREGITLALVFVTCPLIAFTKGRGVVETCVQPTTFSVVAVNTADGAQLAYKHSAPPSAEGTVLFEGLRITSSSGCGEGFERCSIAILSQGDITLVAVPLGQYFGLATFNNDTEFSFREKRAINTTSLDLECDLTSVINDPGAPSDLPTLLSICYYDGGKQKLVDIIFVTVNLTNLTASEDPASFGEPCPVVNPSNFIYFRSRTFGEGVTVYVDQGTVWFKLMNCDFDLTDLCTDVEQFVPISPIHQAIYCSAQVYLLDLAEEIIFPTFSPSEDGVLMFCSSEIYCAYKNNQFTLHRVSDKATLQDPVAFPYGGEVARGDCITLASEFIEVVQLENGTVIAFNLNTSEVFDLGVSSSPPQLSAGHSVLLHTSTGALVFSLQDMDFRDGIAGEFVLGAVADGANIPVPCNISTLSPGTTETSTLSPGTTETSSSSPVLPVYGIALIAGIGSILVLACLVILCCCCCCCWRLRRRQCQPILAVNHGWAIAGGATKLGVADPLLLPTHPRLPPPAIDPQLPPPAVDPQLPPPAIDPQLPPAVDPQHVPTQPVSLDSPPPGAQHPDNPQFLPFHASAATGTGDPDVPPGDLPGPLITPQLSVAASDAGTPDGGMHKLTLPSSASRQKPSPSTIHDMTPSAATNPHHSSVSSTGSTTTTTTTSATAITEEDLQKHREIKHRLNKGEIRGGIDQDQDVMEPVQSEDTGQEGRGGGGGGDGRGGGGVASGAGAFEGLDDDSPDVTVLLQETDDSDNDDSPFDNNGRLILDNNRH